MNGLEDISGRTYVCTHKRTYGRDSLGLQRLRRETKNGQKYVILDLKWLKFRVYRTFWSLEEVLGALRNHVRPYVRTSGYIFEPVH